MRKLHYVGLLVVLILAMTGSLFSQTSFSRLAGTVSDETGGVVPGALVTLARVDTGAIIETITNDSGAYVFGTISPGLYELRCELPGFQAAVYTDLRLNPQTQHRQDIVLETGQITEVITVTSSSDVLLQKSDATVGNTIDTERIRKLPSRNRRALGLFNLQPGNTPGGTVTGSRGDQQSFQLDGIDISENVTGNTSSDSSVTGLLTPAEAIEEFRVAIANPDASFGRSAGASVTMVSKRGTNSWHGSAYWYHQNDNLNSNGWNNNKANLPKSERLDNRYGFTLGGPIIQDKTHFFVLYEGRDLPGTSNITRIVPTQSLRDGILTFNDANGVPQQINPIDFDPRGLGANPDILSIWRQMPLPNTSGGDGLNTGGFTRDVTTARENDTGLIRLDHQFNLDWSLEAKFVGSRVLQNTASQVDLINLAGTTNNPLRTRNATIGLNTAITSTLTNEFRFGWVKDFRPTQRNRPTGTLPWLPASANIALNMAQQILSEPTDVDTQRARVQLSNSDYFQWVNNTSWIRGNHVFQFGVDVRKIDFVHFRDDKVIGSIGLPVAELGNPQFIQITPEEQPASIQPNDLQRYNQLYTASLGIVNQVPFLAVRDGDLQPLPVGSSLEADTNQKYLSTYFLDTWRITSSLTANYGLYYGFTTAPKEKDGKQTIAAFADSGEFITADNFLGPKFSNSIAGTIFNPDVSFLPIANSGQSAAFDTDFRNWSPRAALAWNPSFTDGFLGKLFGDRKTVLRGGYSLLWDRTNTVQTVIIPTLGVGFAQTVSLRNPLNAAGEQHRVGVDGPIPVGTFDAVESPIIPDKIFSEILSFSVDPEINVPYNHVVNFTIQRELPGNMILELGWIGRYSRDLYQSLNLQQAPFFQVDPLSGQSFAQAFDALAGELRAGVAPADVTPQPFFDNALAGTGRANTVGLATAQSSNLINGNLNNLFQDIDIQRFLNDLDPFTNLQSLDLFIRTSKGRSNYNGAVFSLRKNFSDGLVLDANYTFSKGLDQNGAVQNSAGEVPNSFDLNTGYALSDFDATHVFNLSYVWELPFGAGRRYSASGLMDKLLGGWSISGIVQSRSGLPLTFTQGGQGFGGGAIFGNAVGGIPIAGVDPKDFGNGVNNGVAGSNGIGTTGDPSKGGTGRNLFANPEAVFNSFERIKLTANDRAGRNLLKSPKATTFDFSFGKTTTLVEYYDTPITMTLAFDFLNAFNNIRYDNPSLSFTNQANFGVFTGQANTPRVIQAVLRFDF